MPSLAAISIIDFPYKADQQDVKRCARDLFAPSFPPIDKMLDAFDNTEIRTRNFCKPLDYYKTVHSFHDQNEEYVQIALEYSIRAIEKCLADAAIEKSSITDILFVSSTGLATPSLDALIINKMQLNPLINRTPVFGLGCAGGSAGFAQSSKIAIARPDAIVLFVTVELCSLTFLRNDYSKSNFIGSTLFADGVAACIITGDNIVNKTNKSIQFLASQSKLYYDTLDVMGWDFSSDGFKVLFSRDIPTIITENIRQDIPEFLEKNHLHLSDITSFIFHPGGKKVLAAYEEALPVEGDFLKNTRDIMHEYGNMSAPTVLYVLDRVFKSDFEDGIGLMASMGPGFSSEFVLLQMQIH